MKLNYIGYNDIKNDYNHETNNRAKNYIPPLWVNFLADAKIDVG